MLTPFPWKAFNHMYLQHVRKTAETTGKSMSDVISATGKVAYFRTKMVRLVSGTPNTNGPKEKNKQVNTKTRVNPRQSKLQTAEPALRVIR